MVKQVKKGNFITRHLNIIWTQVLSDGVRGVGDLPVHRVGDSFSLYDFFQMMICPESSAEANNFSSNE